VYICKRCGAIAVDARGLCHNCGWQASANDYFSDDSDPSLGETRAAEAPYVAPSLTSQATRTQRATTQGPMQGATRIMTPTPPQPRGPRASSDPLEDEMNAGGARYCGTCGARLEEGQAFCGQCGSPVESGERLGGATVAALSGPANGANAPVRYHIGDERDWEGTDNNPTEMFTDAAPARSPYGVYSPYGPGVNSRGRVASPPYGDRGYQSDEEDIVPAVRSARATKILFGVLCLIGSAITAIAAIVLALLTFH